MITSERKAQRVLFKPEEAVLFDQYTLRAFVGGIAFFFPWVVRVLASTITTSISASYHTDARDFFVGFLFVIGALLMGYKGHKPELPPGKVGKFWNWAGGFLNLLNKILKLRIMDFRVWGRMHEEDLVSTIAGLAAITAAICPTACDDCVPGPRSNIHLIAAGILFSTVVYFCLVAFLRSAKDKCQKDADGKFTLLRVVKEARKGEGGVAASLRKVMPAWKEDGDKVLRSSVYLVCGWGIAAIMIGSLLAPFLLSAATSKAIHFTFWAETAALDLFGIAWFTAATARRVKPQ